MSTSLFKPGQGPRADFLLDGVVFAPLGHIWLSTMQRIQLSSTLKSAFP